MRFAQELRLKSGVDMRDADAVFTNGLLPFGASPQAKTHVTEPHQDTISAGIEFGGSTIRVCFYGFTEAL